MEIHLEGYLGRDYDGILGLSETKTDDEWEYKSIVDSLETLADEKGAKYRYKKGLGGRRAFIPNANIRIYVTEEKCSLDNAILSLIATFEGELKTDVALVGYSEYTITGLCLNELSIGGHDLEAEMSQHEDKYIHFILDA